SAMALKSNCASTPWRLLRYWNCGAIKPCAISAAAAPSRSSMSSVGGWKVEARDSSLRSAPASNTVTGTPACTRFPAAPRPAAPAPAINARWSTGMLLRNGSRLRVRRPVRGLRLVFARDELAAQELTHGRPRDRFDEHVTPRPLVLR